ncbi:MAG: AmmeMemoRadiSam system protein A [Nitrospirae bacterium]|nr:AmmeMemoRadiSam system protein A [Nitrospirota bacterium]
MHPIVVLVKRAVEEYIKKARVIKTPDTLTEEMAIKAGVFVCLKKHGQLRGCIGTIEPVTDCAAEEAIRNAISSSTQDPRFSPVTKEELKDLEYSVDVLCPPEDIRDISELDSKKYGVIVSKGIRKGLLLPDLEGVDSVEEQLRIAKLKAGIHPDDSDVRIQRFEVRRYK